MQSNHSSFIDSVDRYNFGDCLVTAAAECPDKVAFIFQEGAARKSIMYHELHLRALSVSVELRKRVAVGERALLVYPPGLDYIIGFMGCLYAGVVAVPVYPPATANAAQKLRTIVDDCAPAVILTDSTTNRRLSQLKYAGMAASIPIAGRFISSLMRVSSSELDTMNASLALDVPFLATDELPFDADVLCDQSIVRQEKNTLAFLQYTSGSTGNPKGVMVSHANLLHNIAQYDNVCSTYGARFVSWLPPYHDFGLIGFILAPIYYRAETFLFSPIDFLKDPIKWIIALSDHKATISAAPNFAYGLVAKRYDAKRLSQIRNFNLNSVQLLLAAAEPVRKHTVQQFLEKYNQHGLNESTISPGYGLAEGTLIISGRGMSDPFIKLDLSKKTYSQNNVTKPETFEDTMTCIGCGPIFPYHDVFIVNPDTGARLSYDQIGEIWIKSESVAKGYWNKPDLTRELFHAFTEDNQGPCLRTGDLGFMHEGQLFISGRLKDLIIVAGKNYYPQDIEEIAEDAYDGLLRKGCSAAFPIERDNQEVLVVVLEVRTKPTPEQADVIFTACQTNIFEQAGLMPYALMLVPPRTLQKTTSGKIMRRSAKEAWLTGALDKISYFSRTYNTTIDISPTVSLEHGVMLIQAKIIDITKEFLGTPIEIDPDMTFSHLGIHSALVIPFKHRLEDAFGITLSATTAFNYPTIRKLAEYIHQGRVSISSQRYQPSSTSEEEPIAIVGMQGYFPGAENLDRYWSLLTEAKSAIKKEKRFSFAAGLLNFPIEEMDANFFDVYPAQAKLLDPQHRLLLEVVWGALEDAGINPGSLADQPVGVFMGMSSNDYLHLICQRSAHNSSGLFIPTGNAFSAAVGRISYFLDLKGPNMAVDTACSSSLVAVHLACASLRRGESSMVLAGGVNVLLASEVFSYFTEAGMLSPTGSSKPFDAKADGYIRGEGCGVVVLKRLSDALAAGDRIQAVIRGSAMNQDGATTVLTAPNGLAQEQVIRSALQNAALMPHDIDYVEAHGTGTKLGDPIEMEALGNVYGKSRTPENPLKLGAVKANIGHLEAAAGIAGLIKLVLSLQHQTIPAQCSFDEVNPAINAKDLNLSISAAAVDWLPSEHHVRRAGISSFGFSGTNAHVIVEESTVEQPTEEANAEKNHVYLLVLSAKTPEALEALRKKYLSFLMNTKESMADIAFTAGVGRAHFNHRLVVIGQTLNEWQAQLNDPSHWDQMEANELVELAKGYLNGQEINWGDYYASHAIHYRKVKIPQYVFQRKRYWVENVNPLTEMLFANFEQYRPKYPLDRLKEGFEQLERLGFAYIQHFLLEAGWMPEVGEQFDHVSLMARLQVRPEHHKLFFQFMNELAKEGFLEPLTTTWQVVKAWSSKEIVMQNMNLALVELAHYPELSIERSLLCRCGKSLLGVLTGTTSPLELLFPQDEREAAKGDATALYRDSLSMQLGNAVLSKTLVQHISSYQALNNMQVLRILEVGAGTGGTSRSILSALKQSGIRYEYTYTDISSGFFFQAKAEFGQENIVYKVLNIESNPEAQGFLLNHYDVMIASNVLHATKNLSETLDHTRSLLKPEGILFLLEIGESSRFLDLTFGLLEGWWRFDDQLRSSHALLAAEQWNSVLRSHGFSDVAYCGHPYMILMAQADQTVLSNQLLSRRVLGQETGHPLLGQKLILALSQTVYHQVLTASVLKELQGHQVVDYSVMPATAYVELFLAAAKDYFKSERVALDSVFFHHPLLLENKDITLQVILEKQDGASIQASIYSFDGLEQRQLHAVATVMKFSKKQKKYPIEALKARVSGGAVLSEEFYSLIRRVGYQYTGLFQSIVSIVTLDAKSREYWVELRLPSTAVSSGYLYHPALMDGALQAALSGQLDTLLSDKAIALPTAITSVRTASSVTSEAVYAYVHENDVALLSLEGDLLLSYQGLQVSQTPRRELMSLLSRLSSHIEKTLFHSVQWVTSTEKPLALQIINQKKCLYLLSEEKLANDWLAQLSVQEASSVHIYLNGGGYYTPLTGWEAGHSLSSVLAIAWDQIHYGWSIADIRSQVSPFHQQQQVIEQLLVFIQILAREPAGQSQTLRLSIITLGAQSVQPADSPTLICAPLNGLVKTLSLEYPQWHVSHIDLDVKRSLLDQFSWLIQESGQGLEVSYRGHQRWVSQVCWLSHQQQQELAVMEVPYYLSKAPSGSLAVMRLLPLSVGMKRELSPQEVRVSIHAVGLNFRDLLIAMDLYPGDPVPLGSDFSGQILEVGSSVTGYAVGDAVMGIALGSFASEAIVSQELITLKPSYLTYAQAATIPTVYLTNYQALVKLARLTSGDKLLIHTATGGVGLSAINFAKSVGNITIYATAGTPEKRAYLAALGIEYIYDSRSLDYSEKILADTQGKGVDVVLNTLTGEGFVAASLGCCASGARFIELSKRDQWTQAQVLEKRSDIQYHILALDEYLSEHPHQVPDMWQKNYTPLPLTSFAMTSAVQAFEYMQQAKHVGKIVVTVPKPRAQVLRLSDQASYLITGGLSGLGWVTAERLVERGAKELVLVSRRVLAQTDTAIQSTVERWQAAGLRLHIRSVDIGDEHEVADLLAEIQRICFPLKGIFHSAGLLADDPLTNQSWARFEKVFRPKVYGAWHLHTWTQYLGIELDYFVSYSSVASYLGNYGQANHSAANAFLDALAHVRQQQGLAGQSIHWGAWADIGTAVIYKEQHKKLGIEPLSIEEGLAALERTMLNPSQRELAVLSIDWSVASQYYSGNHQRYIDLMAKPAERSQAQPILLTLLERTSKEEQQEIIEGQLKQLVAKVLGVDDVYAISTQKGFTEIGLDSLMMMELRNQVQQLAGDLSLSTTSMFDYPTIEKLSQYIARELQKKYSHLVQESDEHVEENNVVSTSILPRTQMEVTILDIVQQQFSPEKFGVFDSVHDLKGTVSQMLAFYDTLFKLFSKEVASASALYKKQTIAEIACYISCHVDFDVPISTHGFFSMIKNKNTKLILNTLSKGKCYIDQAAEDGKTGLHLAIQLQDEEMASWLLSNGISVNHKTLLGTTPLALAVFAEQLPLIQTILRFLPVVDPVYLSLTEKHQVHAWLLGAIALTHYLSRHHGTSLHATIQDNVDHHRVFYTNFSEQHWEILSAILQKEHPDYWENICSNGSATASVFSFYAQDKSAGAMRSDDVQNNI